MGVLSDCLSGTLAVWSNFPRLLGATARDRGDQLDAMGLFYDVGTTLVSNRLVNVPTQNPTSNVHQWDLKS